MRWLGEVATMAVGLWARWAAMHGIPRAVLKIRARRGDPLARLMAGHGHGIDPYPLYDQIRAQGPLVRTRFAWVTADHAVCRDILRDKRFGVVPPAELSLPAPLRALIRRTDPGVPNPVEPPAMVIVDPPDHTRYRQLVAHSFTPRAISTLEGRVIEVTQMLIERLADLDEPELIADFAAPLPVAIIADVLDIPEHLRPHLLTWGHAGAPLLDVGIGWRTYRHAIESLRGAGVELAARFAELHAHGGSQSPFGRLAADGALTERELTANATLLVGAGFETTVNLIGNGIVALLQHRDQLDLLQEQPELWPAAIEEILRLHSPVQMTARTPHRDLDIAGQHIRTGQTVALLLGGANHDPTVFPEPERLDVSRPNAGDHLAFASGIHACLGAALARIEGITALRALFETFPHLSLTQNPQWCTLTNLRGHPTLPATTHTKETNGLVFSGA
jgi:cytochrome P450